MKKRIIVVIACFIVCLWGYFFFRINTQYQETEEILYQTGEWIELSPDLEIRAKSYYFMDDAEIRNLENVPDESLYSSEMKLIWVIYEVRNTNNEEIVDNIVSKIPLESDGWYNYGDMTYCLEEQDASVSLKSGDIIQTKIPYLLLRSNFRTEEWKKIETKEYSVILSLYPQKRKIIL